jgi:hypothetical protein
MRRVYIYLFITPSEKSSSYDNKEVNYEGMA